MSFLLRIKLKIIMKTSTLKLIALVLTLVATLSVNAQSFQGKAYFKSHVQMNVSMGNQEMSTEQQAKMKAMMQSQLDKEYILLFDQKQSNFKEQEKLGSPTSQSGGMRVMAFSGVSSELYKNTKENRFTSKRDLFGKEFLVKDKLEKPEWELSKETKQIGQYTCHKATSTRTVPGRRMIDGNGNEKVGEPREVTTTAWYTPEIPVSNGPDMYWGLPGLIMEIKDGNMVLICTKIVINSDKKESIVEPSKGKVVTEAKYDEMMEAKMQEMQKMYQGGKQKGGAHSMSITIDG